MASVSLKDSFRIWLYRFLLSFSIAVVVLIFVQDLIVPFGFFDRMQLSFIDRSFEKRGPLNISKDSLDIIIISIS
ncbi:MAG: hypothetical protein WCT99_12665, partial [Bacteroidota bacterium]